MAILCLLTSRPGQLVDREQLKQLLWPRDTFVDFERGLNAAVTRLRAALGDSPSKPRYIETEARRGYRFIAEVTHDGAAPEERPTSLAVPRRLIVLPFHQLQPDAETAYLAFSLPDAITSWLVAQPGLLVRSTAFASRWRGDLAVDFAAVAQAAEVDAIVTGTLLRCGDALRITVQLADAPSGAVRWSHTATASQSDIFALHGDLSQRIAQSLFPRLALTAPGAPSTALAYEFYLRGNHLSSEMRDLTLARDMYRQCIREDPAYAPAWARLAGCHRVLAKFGDDSQNNRNLAEEAYRKAFALNPNQPGVNGLYAIHETEQGRAPEAIVRLLRLLREHPAAVPDLYTSLVYACRFAGLVEESVAAHRAAQALDPNVRTSVMNTHFAMGQYDLALQSSTDRAGFMEAMALDALGRKDEALRRVRNRREALPPLLRQWLEMLDSYLSGRNKDAVHQILEIGHQGSDPEGFYYRARLLAKLGRHSAALDSLQKALQSGFFCAPSWRREAYFEGLCHLPEFHQLLATAEARTASARHAFEHGNGPKLLGL